MAKHSIVLIPGDGIGPEVTRATRRVLEAAGLSVEWVELPAGSSAIEQGFDKAEVELVRSRLAGTHWKRKLPTVAMLSQSAIGESYLRPVDY